MKQLADAITRLRAAFHITTAEIKDVQAGKVALPFGISFGRAMSMLKAFVSRFLPRKDRGLEGGMLPRWIIVMLVGLVSAALLSVASGVTTDIKPIDAASLRSYAEKGECPWVKAEGVHMPDLELWATSCAAGDAKSCALKASRDTCVAINLRQTRDKWGIPALDRANAAYNTLADIGTVTKATGEGMKEIAKSTKVLSEGVTELKESTKESMSAIMNAVYAVASAVAALSGWLFWRGKEKETTIIKEPGKPYVPLAVRSFMDTPSTNRSGATRTPRSRTPRGTPRGRSTPRRRLGGGGIFTSTPSECSLIETGACYLVAAVGLYILTHPVTLEAIYTFLHSRAAWVGTKISSVLEALKTYLFPVGMPDVLGWTPADAQTAGAAEWILYQARHFEHAVREYFSTSLGHRRMQETILTWSVGFVGGTLISNVRRILSWLVSLPARIEEAVLSMCAAVHKCGKKDAPPLSVPVSMSDKAVKAQQALAAVVGQAMMAQVATQKAKSPSLKRPTPKAKSPSPKREPKSEDKDTGKGKGKGKMPLYLLPEVVEALVQDELKEAKAKKAKKAKAKAKKPKKAKAKAKARK